MTLFDNNHHLMMMLMTYWYIYICDLRGWWGWRVSGWMLWVRLKISILYREWWPWRVGSPTSCGLFHHNTQCNEDQITIQRVILNCGENMEVLLGDGSWVCNKHQNQFTRNKEGSQNNCGDSQSNCLSGMQFIFVFYMFQVLLVRWSFWFWSLAKQRLLMFLSSKSTEILRIPGSSRHLQETPGIWYVPWFPVSLPFKSL
jgi:hypothetical protein